VLDEHEAAGSSGMMQFAPSTDEPAGRLLTQGPRPLHWFCVALLRHWLLVHVLFAVHKHAVSAVLHT
jgi:hypothetical protein